MRDMKDSGVQWIGEMPKSWGIIRFKYLHNGLNTGEAIDKKYWSDDEDSRLFYTAGLVPIRTDYTDFPLWKYTTADDLLLARNGTPYVYFPKVGACYTDHIIRASMKSGVCKKFIQYCLQRSIASVVVETVSIPTWSASLWNKQELTWPTYDEQIKIADILDEKCSQVDTLITNVQAQIEKLKAYKQSLITEVVTKGLDPTMPMKDSGVEWMGDIPAHWEVKRGKALFQETEARSVDGSEELLTVSQYTGITPRSQKNVNMFESLTLEGYKICEIGDIAANTMWLWAGAIGVSKYRGVISPSYNVYRQKSSEYVPEYLDILLRAPMLVQEYASLSTGIRASRLRCYPKDFLNIRFPVPPLKEQEKILCFFAKKFASVDRLISIKQAKIEKLEQYKRSLIYEYVTGKKEVTV